MNRTNLIDDLTLVPPPIWWQNPWVVLLAVLLLGALIWGLDRWFRRPRTFAAPAFVGPPGPWPGDEALRRLLALKARVPGMKHYDLAIEASEILRVFIEGAHALPIRYQTTREFLTLAADSAHLSVPQRQILAHFLGFCDLAKFARQPATQAEMVQSVETAIQFVQSAAQAAHPPAAAQPGGAA